MAHNPRIKIKRKDEQGWWEPHHEAILGLKGGADDDHWHLTQLQHDDLTDGGLTELHRHYSEDIQVNKAPGSTYANLQDFINTTQGSGLLTGGEITDGGSGTVDVTAGTAMIRDVNDPAATILFIDFPAKTGLVLTNDTLNIIYVDYNNGSPTVLAGTDLYTHVDETTQIVIGLVYREDSDIHISRTGQILSRLRMRQWLHNLEHHWFHRTAGIATSHTGTRNIAITPGVAWFGFNRFETESFDSSGTDRFDYYYRSATPGQWTVVTDQSQIDNTYWDDGTGTLNDLTVNRYGNHWVYMVTDGDVYVVYGRGDYTLAQAQASTPPADLPDELSSIGMLIAKIIIQKSASSFVQVYLPWAQSLGFSAASDHGSLAGLGDQVDHTWALTVDGSRPLTGDWSDNAGSIILNNNKYFGIKNVAGAGKNMVYLTASNLVYLGHADFDTRVQGANVILRSNSTDALVSGSTQIQANLELYAAAGLTLDGGISVDSILDQDDFYSDSDTALATQQSIKAYIDTETLDLAGTRAMTGALHINANYARIRAASGGSAKLEIVGDDGEDNADWWMIESATDNNLNIANYASGDWVNKLSVDTDGDLTVSRYCYASHFNMSGAATDYTPSHMPYIYNSDGFFRQKTWANYLDDVGESLPEWNLGAPLTTNGAYRGKTILVDVDDATVVAGACLAIAADFNYDRSDADAAANSIGLVLALEAGSGSGKKVLVEGMFCSTGWSWSNGYIYLSTTAGGLTQTQPSGTGDQVVAVGWALSATCIYFKPSLVLVEVA